jgi:DNA-binding MarR family transcriptional regulator
MLDDQISHGRIMAFKTATRRKKNAPSSASSKAKPRLPRTGREDLRLWLRLLSCSARIESVLQRRIANEFGVSLARFDLMAQLERVEDGLTMSEVSRRMMVSNGATTSLVDRLVEDGLVLRKAHPEDRRTIVLHLTERGRERFLNIAKEHERWVIGLLAGLDSGVKQDLLSGLADLKQHLERQSAQAG